MNLHGRAQRRRGSFESLEPRRLLAISMLPVTVVATPGVSFSGEVATFIDPGVTASGFNSPPGSVSIDWGDGLPPTDGTVVATATSGLFDVDGVHTYSQPGAMTTQVNITDQNGQTGSTSGVAVVLPAAPTPQPTPTPSPQLTVVANSISQYAATTPVPTQTVANFLDPITTDAASSFSAVIAWGDGHSSPGTVTGSAGTFTVTGSNPYAVPGNYTFTATIVGDSGTLTGSASGLATVYSPPPPTTPPTGGITTPLTGELSTEVFSNGPRVASGFTNTNRPTFSGTAPAYTVVQVYARHFNADAVLPLGETVADADGDWTLTTGPLARGKYIASATFTLPGGYPTGPVPLDGGEPIFIDLRPKTVRVPSHRVKAGPHDHHSRMPHSPPKLPQPAGTGPHQP